MLQPYSLVLILNISALNLQVVLLLDYNDWLYINPGLPLTLVFRLVSFKKLDARQVLSLTGNYPTVL